MKRSSILLAGVSLCILGLHHRSSGAVPSFQGLGRVPGTNEVPDYTMSYAHDISGDGSVVVGESYTVTASQAHPHGFRWESGVMMDLGTTFQAHAASQDGSVITGPSLTGSKEALRWENGSIQNLLDQAGLPVEGRPWGISADGSIIAVAGCPGSSHWSDTFIWRQNETELLTDHYTPDTKCLSGDASVVVGADLSGPMYAFRRENGVTTTLGDFPGGNTESRAFAVSADGSTVVGFGTPADSVGGLPVDREAFRWTQSTGMVGLGDLPGGQFYSWASDVSADGSVVVGYSITSGESGKGTSEAFLWDAANGMRNLRTVLVTEHGLDLSGWLLSEATAISDDGLVIVGNGTNPDGVSEAWIAAVPEPTTAVLLPISGLWVFRRRRSCGFASSCPDDPHRAARQSRR